MDTLLVQQACVTFFHWWPTTGTQNQLSSTFEGQFLAHCFKQSFLILCLWSWGFFFFWTHIWDFTLMPIKFHPVVSNLNGSRRSSDSTSTEALSPEELQTLRNGRVQRSQALRTKNVPATAERALASSALCLSNTRMQETAFITRAPSRKWAGRRSWFQK